jgi:tetratricopeptide (TPR) repeat protein
MQYRMPASERLIQRMSTGRALRLSLSLTLMLISCAVMARAQMRPMSSVTVGQRESANKQRAASTQTSATKAAPLSEAKAQDASTLKTASRENSATVTRTRARRVAPETASTTGQTGAEVKEKNSVEASVQAGAKTQGNAAGAMDAEDEPPVMASEAKGEAKVESRLNILRAQVEDAKDERERGRLRRMLVDYLVSLDQKHEAVEELRSMMREERFDPVGFYNIGNALVRLDDANTAIDAYRKAISQRHGNYARALNNMGVVLLRQGRWDEAQESLISALRQENYRYAEASYNLGRLYAARGEADLAIAEWRRTLLIQPDHSDAALALARAYAEDGSPQRGLQVLDQFTQRSGPANVFNAARQQIVREATSIQSERTAVKVSNNATPEAASALRPLQVDTQTYELLQRARAAREGGHFEESVGFYHRVLEAHKGFFPPANLEMSYALINLKRTDEAIASLSALTAKEGAHYPVAYYHLARLYEAQGHLTLAEQNYNQALAAYGDTNPQLLLDLSRIREQSGNITGALAALESYLRANEREGRTPDWANAQLTRLRQKLAATSAPKQ